MIPIRVQLENFLCYRETVEFRFDDEPLWVLGGPNGVGKSAVVDAMTYALFGKYRGSERRSNSAEALIHHGENAFRVEFDFEYGNRRYRIWRIRPRRSQPKQGVAELTDLSAPDGAPNPIRNVDKVEELNDWVIKTLGLSFESFVSTVLLRQGAAERLIDADRSDRLDILRGIIDFQRYIDLHARIAEAARDLGRDVRHFRGELDRLPTIDREELDAARADHVLAEEVLKAAKAAEDEARALLGPARTWEWHETHRLDLLAKLQATAERVAQADQLERAMHRLQELRMVVPALDTEAQRSRELEAARVERDRSKAERDQTETDLSELSASADQLRQQVDAQRDRLSDLDLRLDRIEADRQRLGEMLQQAAKVAGLRQRLEELKAKIDACPADLDHRLADAESDLAASRMAQETRPHLNRIERHRSVFQQSRNAEQLAADREANHLANRDQVRAELASLGVSEREATERQQTVEQARIAADTRLDDARFRRDRFNTLAESATCSECGQPITDEHKDRERNRLERAATDAETEAKRLRAEQAVADETLTQARCRLRATEAVLRAVEQDREAANRDRQEATRRVEDARTEFDNALAAIAEPCRSRVPPIETKGFPTTADLDDFQQLANDLPARSEALKTLEQQAKLRDNAKQEIDYLSESIAVHDPSVNSFAVQTDLAQLDEERNRLKNERDQHVADRNAAKATLDRLVTQIQETRDKLFRFIQCLGSAESTLQIADRFYNKSLAALPESYRSPIGPPGEAVRAALASELDQLERDDVEAQHKTLINDQALQADWQQHLQDAEREIVKVPEAARRPVNEIQALVNAREQAVGEAEQVREEAKNRLAERDRQFAERNTAEQRLDQTDRKYRLHDRLAGLLGERGLQLDLVRDTELEILGIANEVLIRISDGELRFDRPAGASDRAFELIFRRTDCSGPIGAANLSGGQRFRVAVALALAICRFAGRQARPLESIFIDEGFGALDRPGRIAMIDELRQSQGLRRIILISHQEDFADAFPVGYRLRSEEGRTLATAFGRT